MWFTSSYGRIEIEMTLKQAESVSHPGQCDMDVKELLNDPKIKRQLAKISDENLIKELSDYGAWDKEELQNRSDNEMRIIWIAGCDIVEENFQKEE